MNDQLPEGTKVEFSHNRRRSSAHVIEPRGGVTTAYIYEDKVEGRVLATAQAHCSDEDNYNKKIGRQISLGRALKKLSAE